MNLAEKLSLALDWVNKPHIEDWQSLVINLRKPETFRMFRFMPDGTRLCLHRFSDCEEGDAFPHPHAWPMECIILNGYYTQQLFEAPNYEDPPNLNFPCSTHLHNPGSYYRLNNPLVWHRIVPHSEYVYTLMLNGMPWKMAHKDTRTTKGKDLEGMTDEQKKTHLDMFQILLKQRKDDLRKIAVHANDER